MQILMLKREEEPIKLRKLIRRTLLKGRVRLIGLIRLIRPIKRPIGLIIKKIINISPLISIIISLIVAIFAYWLSTPGDFAILADPMGDNNEPEYRLFHFLCNLTIKDTTTLSLPLLNDITLKHYQYPVVLEANYFYNGTPLPENIKVSFKPQGNTSIPFNSSANISCSNISAGDLIIKISAHGGDGRQRDCGILLGVKRYHL